MLVNNLDFSILKTANSHETLPTSTLPSEIILSFLNGERAPSGTSTLHGPFKHMPRSQGIRLRTEKS